MTYLSRDDILKPRDLKVEEVDVPEWGGIVRVRELTAEAAADYEASMIHVDTKTGTTKPDFTNRRAKLVALSIVDEDGNLMLSPVDVQTLGGQSAVALERVADVAERLSGMNADAVKDAEGNSEAALGGDSISS
jgi:hypothetical protein